jgi:DnaJ-class molecular chaperone
MTNSLNPLHWERCSVCRGSGLARELYYPVGGFSVTEPFRNVTCLACNGHGGKWVRTTIDVKERT